MKLIQKKISISMFISSALLLALPRQARADQIVWDGGPYGSGYEWGDTRAVNWVGDVNPGPSDEAYFPPSFWRTSFEMLSPQTVETVAMANPTNFTFKAISPNTLSFTNLRFEDADNRVVTNTFQGTFFIGKNSTWQVDGKKLMLFGSGSISTIGESESLVKTGSGTVRITAAFNPTGAVTVAEGKLILGDSAALIKGERITIGDGVSEAAMETRFTNGQNLGYYAGAIVTINTNATLMLRNTSSSLGTLYPETYIINGGALDAGGNTLHMYNVTNTINRIMSLTMTGGVISNGAVTVNGPDNPPLPAILSTKASVRTARIEAGVNFSGYRTQVLVEDGAAPVDLDITGVINGNMQFTKTGAGTLALSHAAGNTIFRTGQSLNIEGGTLLIDNIAGQGNGSNTVAVLAGATLGGIGLLYGGVSPANTGHGLQGNVNLSSANPSAPATLAPGTIDRESGEFVPGVFRVGLNIAQTNHVNFGANTALRIRLSRDPEETPRVAVVGEIILNAATALEIVSPGASRPAGRHVVATFAQRLRGRFGETRLNGAEMPGNLRLEYLDSSGEKVAGAADIIGAGSIVLDVPQENTMLIVR